MPTGELEMLGLDGYNTRKRSIIQLILGVKLQNEHKYQEWLAYRIRLMQEQQKQEEMANRHRAKQEYLSALADNKVDIDMKWIMEEIKNEYTNK